MIIGITGPKFNGKNTLGNYFVKLGYIELSFAESLKESCRCIFGFSDDQLYGDKKETEDEFWGVSPRVVLQYVGTELYREQLAKIMPHIGKNIWVECIRRKILLELEKNKKANFVITDVRFPNEIEMVKELGGKLIRVVRDSVNNTSDLHESERLIMSLPVDYELKNNGTIEELHEKAREILNPISKNQDMLMTLVGGSWYGYIASLKE